jgi:hypothetical protein
MWAGSSHLIAHAVRFCIYDCTHRSILIDAVNHDCSSASYACKSSLNAERAANQINRVKLAHARNARA